MELEEKVRSLDEQRRLAAEKLAEETLKIIKLEGHIKNLEEQLVAN